jgi:DNA-binding transcriptional ArsR family regulator
MWASRRTAGSAKPAGKAASPPRARTAPTRAAEGAHRPVDVFAALGDATRLALVDSLCANGVASTAQLTTATTISRQAVTKHLRVLAGAGLVSDIRDGRERLWQLEPRPLADARHALERIARQWDDALFRLQRHVEAPERPRGG